MVCVIAGGEGKRWGNYLGIRKQFAEINGEKIIYRIKRLFDPDVIITRKGWEVEGVKNVYHKPDKSWHGIDKLHCSVPYWNQNGKTLLILGDVYFTDEAAETIKNYDKRDWAMFGRLRRSKVKEKKNFNENFALSFYPEHHDQVTRAMRKSVQLYLSGKIPRNYMAQWYRIMHGKEGKDAHFKGYPQENLGNFVTIDDGTDDVDYPSDYTSLKKYHEKIG